MKALAIVWMRKAWRYWPAVAAAASALMLMTAHIFQAFGYEPCALCLTQREVYWSALAIAVVSAIVWVRRPDERISRAVDALLGAAFMTGAFVALYHAGVEWKFWPGPPTCVGSVVAIPTADDIAAALTQSGVVALCDQAAWRDPVLQLSMAGWNALISLALAAASALAASRGTGSMAAAVDE
jgi:disulfide bond formation protein DsbB